MSGLYRGVTHTEPVVGALQRWPDREAFRQDGHSLTYAQTADLIARVVAVLRARGLRQGTGVGILSPNRPEVWIGQTAANLAGARYTALLPWAHSPITSTPATRQCSACCWWTQCTPSARPPSRTGRALWSRC